MVGLLIEWGKLYAGKIYRVRTERIRLVGVETLTNFVSKSSLLLRLY